MPEKLLNALKSTSTQAASLLNWLLPSICILCGAHSERNISLCEGCETDLPSLNPGCERCAHPLEGTHDTLCGACLQHPPPFEKIYPLFAYQPPLDKIITGLKFQKKLVSAQLLGTLLANHLKTTISTLPDIIIPVPLHKKRLRERGFNQALEIARPISKRFNIPIDINHCQRTIPTQPQTLVKPKERQQNVRNAFQVKSGLEGKRVLIIDDVVTTGHTVAELSRELKKKGVISVEIGCCARAI